MTTPTPLTTAARELHNLHAELEAFRKSSTVEINRIRGEIEKREAVIKLSADGIDHDKVALAKTIIYVTDYTKGGDEWKSCVADAITQLSTGEPKRPVYGDLWRRYFGTKSYDRWHGQRSDHEYGYGPRHGSIIFRVEITRDARARKQWELTPEEVEAAIYYLTNLTRIQDAERKARDVAMAS